MSRKILSPEIYERQADIAGALAHPVRMMVLDLLGQGEATATELLEIIQIPKSNLSQHLSVLKRAGLLKVRSEGLLQHLSLAAPQVKEACGLVRQMLIQQMERDVSMAKALRQRT